VQVTVGYKYNEFLFSVSNFQSPEIDLSTWKSLYSMHIAFTHFRHQKM